MFKPLIKLWLISLTSALTLTLPAWAIDPRDGFDDSCSDAEYGGKIGEPWRVLIQNFVKP